MLEMYEEWWDEGAKEAAKSCPLKQLKRLPKMKGIAEKRLKWKSLKWIFGKDKGFRCTKLFLRHPFRYGFRLLRALFGKPYRREGDFFFYDIDSPDELFDGSVFVIGFSYCHKPFECPSGRFSPNCIRNPNHPVCRQCFIGKALNLQPQAHVVIIPTVHDIGYEMLKLADKNITFLITACEMTLEMFGPFGKMVGARGIGVRLDGRICNTMKAFALSERGIKPGLTVVLPEAQKKILEILHQNIDTTSGMACSSSADAPSSRADTPPHDIRHASQRSQDS